MMPCRGSVSELTPTGRPKLTVRSQMFVTLSTVLVCGPTVFLAATLPNVLAKAQCPISTFYRHRIVMGSSAAIFGMITIAICPPVIMACMANALKLLRYAPPYEPSPFARRARLYLLAIASTVLALGWVALIDDADRFFCMSPDGILIRRGLEDTAHHYSWSEVRTMYVSCLIARLPKQPPFPGANVNLALRNGEHLVVGLRGSDEHVMMSLKSSLSDVDYKFYVNRTVTPELCPGELYQHIWNWLIE